MNDNPYNSAGTAVFDICDTLYYSNTTHDFIRFVVDREPSSAKTIIYKALNSRLLPFRYLLIFYSVKTGRDILKKFNVSILSGRLKDELNSLAKRFVREFLSKRIIEHTHELVAKQLGAGRNIVLCSSSIDPVVAAVADELNITDFIGTSLEYDGDVFTGRIAEDITHKKFHALLERGLLGRLAFAVSDNISDLELLTNADEALAIVHGTRKEEFWKGHNVNVIKLGQ